MCVGGGGAYLAPVHHLGHVKNVFIDFFIYLSKLATHILVANPTFYQKASWTFYKNLTFTISGQCFKTYSVLIYEWNGFFVFTTVNEITKKEMHKPQICGFES